MTRAVSNSAAPRGWRKPPGAVVVSRPTRWGNPDSVAGHGQAGAAAFYCQYLAQHPGLADAARCELAGAIQSLY